MPAINSPRIKYAFAVGRVRVLETRMVGAVRVRRLLEARTLDEIHRVLSETDYGPELRDITDVDDAENALDNHLERVYALLNESNLPPEISTYFRCRFDFLNLRILLKSGLHQQLEAGLSAFGEVNQDSLISTTEHRSFSELPPHLESAAVDALGEYERSGRFDDLDISLDRAYFKTLSRLADAIRSKWVSEYTKLQIDLANGRISVRIATRADFRANLSHYFIAGGRVDEAAMGEFFSGGIAEGLKDRLSALPDCPFREGMSDFVASGSVVGEYDLIAENRSIDFLLTSHRFTVGPEPVFAYIAAREHETKVLRVIITGLLSGVPSERVPERLSRIYE